MKATPPTWKDHLREGVDGAISLESLPLSADELAGAQKVSELFKVRVPKHYLDLVDWDDPLDPIRRQVIPAREELDFHDHELADPIGDKAHSPVPRLTHRYPDRVLIYPTYVCPVYCRYCFRKESLNEEERGFSREVLEPAFAYVRAHPEVAEVILTGGDPLFLSEGALRYMRERLEAIDHVRLLRLHTRVPVALPARITNETIVALKGRLMVCVVTHFNHPREITPAAEAACRLIREGGFMLLNQTVLLKDVNDDAETLRALFRELVYRLGAKPYYLHHCDLTRGLGHMRTSIERGQSLMRDVRGHISGVCNPTYVLDLPGGAGKIPIGPSYARAHEGDAWLFDTYDGKTQEYREIVSPGTLPPREP
jgi:lysine 2,3-aminomutase